MCCGTEAGSYLRLKDSCIAQLEAHGPARTCNESKEEEGGLAAPKRACRPAPRRDGGPYSRNPGILDSLEGLPFYDY